MDKGFPQKCWEGNDGGKYRDFHKKNQGPSLLTPEYINFSHTGFNF